MRRLRPVLAAVALATALVGTANVGPATAAAAGCRADQVTVVVDFGSLGGGAAVRCVTNPSSGLDALAKAGFGYGFRPNFPGMVCTIDTRPDPCNGAPADAYWAYWHAPAGGGWTYSTQGAGSRVPPAGSVEGWAFGDDRRPSVSPPAPTPPPTVATTVPPTTRVMDPPRSPAPPAPDPAPVASDGSPTAPSATATALPSSTSSTSPTGLPGETSAPGAADRSSDASGTVTELAVDRASVSSGGGTGALVGIAVLVAVAGAAGWEFRRRRIT